MDLKPIPTTYRSVTFRSRLEARWAAFFDSMNTEWLYEYEGFSLPSGRYLPDFWLPSIRTWIEIKPKDPSDREKLSCEELSVATGDRVILLPGPPGFWLRNNTSDGGYLFHEGWDCFYLPCVCNVCGKMGIEYDGRGDRVCRCHTCGENYCDHKGDKGYSADDASIVHAAKFATSYRFW